MSIGRVNTGGGGGSANTFAVIHTTYPEGSTCTCSNGTKTLTAKDTSGVWNFLIPEAGNWTVTATDGTHTTSKTVSITAQGQVEALTLAYEVYLLSTSGFTVNFVDSHTQGAGTATTTQNTIHCGGATDCMRTESKIDLGSYSQVRMKFHVISVSNNYPVNLVVTDVAKDTYAYCNTNQGLPPTNAIAYVQQKPVQSNTDYTLTLPIGEVTGEHYVGVGSLLNVADITEIVLL